MLTQLILTKATLAAQPEVVWQVLTDFPSHAAWNPFIRSIGGAAMPGGRLRLEMAPAGQKPFRFTARVLVASPGRELRWRGRLGLPGLFDGEHWFRLQPAPGGGTILEHGERFSGVLTPFLLRTLREPTEAAFQAMNAALDKEAERRSPP